ncbi:hypothetical protein F5884DRAFT_662001 [Xylogone sp. PMI_703]|nr:hypothetical protein F5884DRAFT_662001 [Xylogone sp. PMI_703]
MTSTHMNQNDPGQPDVTAPTNSVEPSAPSEQDDSIPDESSFSDAYAEEQPDEMQANKMGLRDEDAEGEDDDDYAMTFDSSEEDHSDNQEKPTTVEQTTLSESASMTTNETTQPKIDLLKSVPETPTSLANPPPAHSTVPDAVVSTTSTGLPTSIPTETVPSDAVKAEQDLTGGIDIQQLLDNITASAGNNASANATKSPSANVSLPQTGSTLLAPPHASLPPRPQPLPQQPPRTTYPSQDDLQNYFAGASNFPQPQAGSYGPPGVNPPIVAPGAPGTFTAGASGLPPPPSASFQPPLTIPGTNQTISTPYPQVQRLTSQDYPARSIEHPDERDEADRPWGPAVQKLYDEFLADERHYVTEGAWDKFPVGSRLFIGNLPTEKVTKRDLFHVFYKYGRLAQISLKQAYGFVQFHDANACYTALDREQGQEVRGRKMHLEISKPQKNNRNSQNNATQRRSRSPEYGRAGNADRGRHGQGGGRGSDRQNARSVPSDRDEFGRTVRARDDYRPGRSPSPSRGYRGRDDYASHGRDYYDGRDRRRSRSRSPYGRRENGRYRDRSLSPRAREANADADLQIPRRDARDVPDVQIILMQELDRGFVSWVEGEFRTRGVKSETMFLSPRLPLEAVIRRQILEGVHAVSQLDMRSQNSSKVPLQVFDRQGGANNVRFDEYRDLDPRIAAELVIRAKQTQPQIPASYSQPQYATNQPYQPPPPAAPAAPAPAPAANLAALVGQLDNNTLQRLLSSLNTIPPQQAPQAPNVAPSSTPSIDLANLLGGLKPQQPPPQVYPPQQSQPDPYASLASNPALASLLGGAAAPQQAQPQPQQSAQQVQNIMAQLAKFRQ